MITYYPEIEQGSDLWLALRCGKLTASEMKLIITPTLKVADNDKCRTHLWELLAQRITGYVEPKYISDDMLRGVEDEVEAKILYAANYAATTDTGFITNDSFGFTLGYSPDAMVGDDGLIECKSRRQKYQAETIATNKMPDEYIMQVQTGLLVSGRKWCDFVSYSGGMPMWVIRILPDPVVQAAIIQAATVFENKLAEKLAAYKSALENTSRLIETKRKVEMEITV